MSQNVKKGKAASISYLSTFRKIMSTPNVTADPSPALPKPKRKDFLSTLNGELPKDILMPKHRSTPSSNPPPPPLTPSQLTSPKGPTRKLSEASKKKLHRLISTQYYSTYTEEVKDSMADKLTLLTTNNQIDTLNDDDMEGKSYRAKTGRLGLHLLNQPKLQTPAFPENKETPVKLGTHDFFYFRIPCKGKLSPLSITISNVNPMVYQFEYSLFISESYEKPNDEFNEATFRNECVIQLFERHRRILFVNDYFFFGIRANCDLFVAVSYQFPKKTPNSRELPLLSFLSPRDENKLVREAAGYLFPEVNVGSSLPYNQLYQMYTQSTPRTHKIASRSIASPTPQLFPKEKRAIDKNYNPIERRKDLLLDDIEKKLFSSRRQELGKLLRSYDQKYQLQVMRRAKIFRSWFQILNFVNRVDVVKDFYVEKREHLKLQTRATFRIARLYPKFKAKFQTRGKTWKERTLNDIRSALASFCMMIEDHSRRRANRVASMCIMEFMHIIVANTKFQTHLDRVVKIQRRWKNYKAKKAAFMQILSDIWEDKVYKIYLGIKTENTKKKKKTVDLSLFIKDNEFKKKILTLYIDELREKYCDHMTRYRKFIKSLSKRKRMKAEYLNFFRNQPTQYFVTCEGSSKNIVMPKAEKELVRQSSPSPKNNNESPTAKFKPPRMFVVPGVKQLKELISKHLNSDTTPKETSRRGSGLKDS